MHVKESNGAVFMRLMDMKDMKMNHTSVMIQTGIASAQYLLLWNEQEHETISCRVKCDTSVYFPYILTCLDNKLCQDYAKPHQVHMPRWGRYLEEEKNNAILN